jgi:hypothetical protein
MVAWLRIALAAAVLVPVAASQRALGAAARRPGTLAVVGAVQVAGPFLLIALGEQEIPSALAGILVATAAIFTAVLAIWVDHEERSEGARLLGIVRQAGVVAPGAVSRAPPSSAASPWCWRAWIRRGRLSVKHRLGHAPPIRSPPGDGGRHDLAAAGGADHGAGLRPRLGPARRRHGAGVVGTGLAFAIFTP